ncbi:hypothetical protein CU048_09485 [Beijerinckiaceae bacterium]|nr:hypothetical protein CU048_09485 [Beijerinckiaceae bacterium]
MAVYSVHLQGDGLNSIAEAAFVRQAFNWKAFFFGPLWLLRHRLWAAFTLWGSVFILLILASPTILSDSSTFMILFAVQLLLGLEANRLLETKLVAQGYHLVEIIAAPALDQAEAVYFRKVAPSDATAAGLIAAPPGAGI